MYCFVDRIYFCYRNCKRVLMDAEIPTRVGTVTRKYVLYYDSQSVINLNKNSALYLKSTKHIEVWYH